MSGLEERSFLQRGRVRRRVQFLRRLREVELRDLGGFMVELHRFGTDRPHLVQEKLVAAAATDAEIRALEHALGSPDPVRELREAGVGGSCDRCGAIYGSTDHFCSSCGEPAR